MILIRLENISLICFGILLISEIRCFYIVAPELTDPCFSQVDFGDAQIFLMQSAQINDKLQREINVYWHYAEFQDGDVIAVYRGKPNNESLPLWELQPNVTSGFIGTGLYLSLLHNYALTSYRETIIVFCGAWLRNGRIQKVNCLSTHPTWMHDKKEILKEQKLSQMMIPGTYLSGLYTKDLPPLESVFDAFSVTQNQDILNQLVHGARYLDIPVGHYPHLNQTYWAVRDGIKIMPLDQILWDTLFFLKGTKEIVMLAFRDFSEGFNNVTDHRHFTRYVKKKFANHLLVQQNLDDPWSITTGKIWNLNKRLIIIYDSYYQARDPFLWPSPWMTNIYRSNHSNDFYNEILASEEINQLLVEFNEEPSRELLRITYLTDPVKVDYKQIGNTCNKECIKNHPNNSRKLGDHITPIVTRIYNERMYRFSNILAAKFLDATGLVNIAILSNEKRAQGCFSRSKKVRFTHTMKTLRFV